MHLKIKIFFLVSIMTLVSLKSVYAKQTSDLTLNDCYELSIKNNLPVEMKKEIINESNAKYALAKSAILPKAYLSLARTKRDSGDINGAEDKFTISQTIFTGFREKAGIEAAKIEQSQRTFEKLNTEQLLLNGVSDSFFSLIEQDKITKTYDDINDIIQKRLIYLRNREKIGRSRKSEVSSTQVILYQNQAQIEAIKALKAQAVTKLLYFTGLTEIPNLNDNINLPTKIESDEQYIKQLDSRPDILALQNAAEIAKKQIEIARADALPNINMNGDYYTAKSGNSNGSWDIGLTAQFILPPTTKSVIANINQMTAKAKEAELQVQIAKRDATLDIKTAYKNFIFALSKQTALGNALKAAEENYKLEINDYQLNLINNLEVLQTIQSLQSARLDYIHSVYETKRAYWNLMVLVGNIK